MKTKDSIATLKLDQPWQFKVKRADSSKLKKENLFSVINLFCLQFLTHVHASTPIKHFHFIATGSMFKRKNIFNVNLYNVCQWIKRNPFNIKNELPWRWQSSNLVPFFEDLSTLLW